MSSTPNIPNVQEPPFPQPFIDTETGLVTPIWQLYIISLFQTQNQQNSGITDNSGAASAAQQSANAAQQSANEAKQQIPVTVGEETTRAEAAETALGTQITAETTRAEAAEALLAPAANPSFSGVASAPEFNVTGASAPTATAGAATLPAAPVGFLVFELGGSGVKVPYYAT